MKTNTRVTNLSKALRKKRLRKFQNQRINALKLLRIRGTPYKASDLWVNVQILEIIVDPKY